MGTTHKGLERYAKPSLVHSIEGSTLLGQNESLRICTYHDRAGLNVQSFEIAFFLGD